MKFAFVRGNRRAGHGGRRADGSLAVSPSADPERCCQPSPSWVMLLPWARQGGVPVSLHSGSSFPQDTNSQRLCCSLGTRGDWTQRKSNLCKQPDANSPKNGGNRNSALNGNPGGRRRISIGLVWGEADLPACRGVSELASMRSSSRGRWGRSWQGEVLSNQQTGPQPLEIVG